MNVFSKKSLIVCYVLLVLVLANTANAGGSSGFIEGHLKMASQKPVELAGGGASKNAIENYSDHQLVILSKDGQKEISKVTADDTGKYRVALPPGEYVLDIQGRASKHLKAQPQPFTIVLGQTTRVDMDIETAGRPN
jgi:hypothetical protein